MVLYAKALHIVFVLTWFAGLFYVVRLFIYQTEAHGRDPLSRSILCNQMKVMAYRLWYMIAWPSALLALIFGGWLLPPWINYTWIWYKLGLVVLLLGYHIYCHLLFLGLQQDKYRLSSFQLRVLNEVPTLLLFPLVFLAVFKHISGLWAGLLTVCFLALLLYFVVRIYKRYQSILQKHK